MITKPALLFVLALGASSVAEAQTAVTLPGAAGEAAQAGQPAGTFSRVAAEPDQERRRAVIVAAPIETKITPGRPYSAEAVTQTVQLLSDGNRIERSSVTKVFRDGEGRTRREMYTQEGVLRSVSINDPVSHVSWSLNPEQKIARRSTINIVSPSGVRPAATGRGGGRGGMATATGEARITAPVPTPPSASGVGGAVLARQPAPDDPNVRTEDLGVQNIEGVSATGKRTTTVIPAGQIGNAQEIRIVSEQWFSDELQVLVMTRHSDPRSGETIYRLRNILRAEPDPSLFTPPADYTVQQPSIRSPE